MKLIQTTDSKGRPVWGIVLSDGKLRYIDKAADLAAYKAIGIPSVKVAASVYNALPRVAGTNLVK